MQFTSSESGLALVTVLLFSALILLTGTGLLSYAVNEMAIGSYSATSLQLYYLAEAGAEAALFALRSDYSYSGQLNGELAGGSFTVQVEHISSTCRRVSSLGLLEGYRKVISFRVSENKDGRFEISEWRIIRPLP